METTERGGRTCRRVRSVNVCFKTTPEVIAMVDRVGYREDRTRSDTIDRILRGLLKPDPVEGEAKQGKK